MLTEFIEVLRKGNILKNPETWKNRQLVVNSIGVIVGFVVAVANAFGLPLMLDPESIAAIGGAVWAIVSLFNNWATIATTTKIGLPNPNQTDS
jgi:hypothetical protein